MTPESLSLECFARSARLINYRQAGLKKTCMMLERFMIRDANALIATIKAMDRVKHYCHFQEPNK